MLSRFKFRWFALRSVTPVQVKRALASDRITSWPETCTVLSPESTKNQVGIPNIRLLRLSWQFASANGNEQSTLPGKNQTPNASNVTNVHNQAVRRLLISVSMAAQKATACWGADTSLYIAMSTAGRMQVWEHQQPASNDLWLISSCFAACSLPHLGPNRLSILSYKATATADHVPCIKVNIAASVNPILLPSYYCCITAPMTGVRSAWQSYRLPLQPADESLRLFCTFNMHRWARITSLRIW